MHPKFYKPKFSLDVKCAPNYTKKPKLMGIVTKKKNSRQASVNEVSVHSTPIWLYPKT